MGGGIIDMIKIIMRNDYGSKEAEEFLLNSKLVSLRGLNGYKLKSLLSI